ncbi:hypothetical protein DAI22_09g052250 [Oryza sativa Japonica Group]|uniref:Uncharacterized protein n=1 Tax=Oryza sativa subsp. japonica TaxID=39947 RepID=Q69NC6_ORYSJ|nr:hypothetical protein DAI22_09g052250 [Oryza sativa Japonica Group]BAD36215.1 hypothetical protein [Oryza sativa Japonica Group]
MTHHWTWQGVVRFVPSFGHSISATHYRAAAGGCPIEGDRGCCHHYLTGSPGLCRRCPLRAHPAATGFEVEGRVAALPPIRDEVSNTKAKSGSRVLRLFHR